MVQDRLYVARYSNGILAGENSVTEIINKIEQWVIQALEEPKYPRSQG